MIIALLNWEVAEVLGICVTCTASASLQKDEDFPCGCPVPRKLCKDPVRKARVLRGECYGDGACWQRAAQLVGSQITAVTVTKVY